MMRFVVAAAELELVPTEIAGHPAIRKHAQVLGRRPSELLLDQNFHAAASRRLDDGARRGRPDITQYTLLTLLESPLAKRGGLEVAVHTRQNVLLRLRRDVRLPRGEQRFQGLLAKVLREGASDDGAEPLITAEAEVSAAEVVRRMGGTPVRLDETGPSIRGDEIPDDALVVVGGFPSGTFPDAWLEAAPDARSLYAEPLAAWAAVAEVVARRVV